MNEKTVSEARNDIRQSLDDGTICPCCGQIAKRYTRKITSSMAYGLIALVRRYQQTHDWVHITELPIESKRIWSAVRGDFAKLRYWGLIVSRETSEDQRSSGYWKPTQLALSFVAGKAHVPYSYGIFNGEVSAISPNKVTIQQALTDKFSYTALIDGIPGLLPEADQQELALG